MFAIAFDLVVAETKKHHPSKTATAAYHYCGKLRLRSFAPRFAAQQR